MFEIERKWLIDRKSAMRFISQNSGKKLNIEQFYTSLNPETRYRKTVDDNNNAIFVKTIKTGSGIKRNENEEIITMTEYETLIVGSSLVVRKVRYVVDSLELDFYPDGLAIMEKEYNSLNEANEDIITFDFLKEEVTGDERYFNATIALRNSKERAS